MMRSGDINLETDRNNDRKDYYVINDGRIQEWKVCKADFFNMPEDQFIKFAIGSIDISRYLVYL